MEKETIQQTRLENSRVYQSSHESEITPSKKKEELQTPISGDFQLKMYLSPTPGKN